MTKQDQLDDQHKRSHNGGRVDETEINGQSLTAEEILARAKIQLQKRQDDQHQEPSRMRKNANRSRRTKRRLLPERSIETKHQSSSDDNHQDDERATTHTTQQRMIEAPIEPSTTETSQATLVKGSAWLSLGNILSRVLGAVYIVPWMALLGVYANQANALFSQGYNIYAIFLAIATMGIPAAISKLVAEYNARQAVYQSRQLMRQSILLGIVLGLVFGSIIYVAAPQLSQWSIKNDSLVPVLHSLAPTVALFPVMSMIRGMFQGYQLMHVSALSQVIEQIARVIYMIAMAVIILNIDPQNWRGVVVQSTFAAFIGAVFSFTVFAWGWLKYRHVMLPTPQNDDAVIETESTRQIIFNILAESWPFIIIGSAITLFQLVDQFSYVRIMSHFFTDSQAELSTKFALFSANPNKIIMIIVPFATSIASTALPMLSGNRAVLSLNDIQGQLKQVLKLFVLVMLPSALGMFAIAAPLYKMFYPIDSTNQEGIYLLQYSSIMAIAFSLFMLLSFVLQALSEVNIVIKSFAVGLVVKIMLQIPLVRYFEGMGALMASVVGMVIAILYMLDFLKRAYGVSLYSISQDIWHMFLANIVMMIVAGGSAFILGHLLLSNTRLFNTLNALISAALGGVVLLFFYFKQGLGDEVLGSKMRYVPNFFKAKK